MAYYFAFGSNLDIEQMKRRFKKFRVHGVAFLKDCTIEFRENNRYKGVANIRKKSGSIIYGVVYDVPHAFFDAMDVFEGVPTTYQRRSVKITLEETGEPLKAITYIMTKKTITKNDRDFFPPSMDYYKRIRRGYDRFLLPQNELKAALHEAYYPTDYKRKELVL